MQKPDLDKRLNELFLSDTWAYVRLTFDRLRSEAMQDIFEKSGEAEACMRLRLLADLEQDLRARCEHIGVQVEPFPKENR